MTDEQFDALGRVRLWARAADADIQSRNQAIVEAAQVGLSLRVIAKEAGVAMGTVANILKRKDTK